MKLTFNSHISSKTHSDFSLKLFPVGEPEDFLKQCTEEEGGEMSAATCEYDFPDDSVVVASKEFGPALVDPDGPVRVTIEVHVGSVASTSVIAAAEAEAKKLAAQAGIEEQGDESGISPGLQVIQH